MEPDDLLNPGLNNTRRFGEETSPFGAAFPFGEEDGFEIRSTVSFVGQDTERLLAYVVFKPTAESLSIKHDGLSALPIILDNLEPSQLHGDDPLSSDSESILAETVDVLLNNAADISLGPEWIFEVSAPNYFVSQKQASNNEVSIPITLLPQFIEELKKPELAEVQQQSTTIYQFNNCQFAGGVADKVQGSQVGGSINNSGSVSSQSCLFELVEETIGGFIPDELPGDYIADPELDHIDIARQIVVELRQHLDVKRGIIKSLRSLEADGVYKKSANDVINIVIAALDISD